MNAKNKFVGEPRNNLNARLNETVFTLSDSAKQGHKASESRKRARKYVMALYVGIIVLLSTALVAGAYAQEGERQAFGSNGVFSYVPPDGWKVWEFPGMKFKVCSAQPAKGFASNITVVDEASEKPLDDYVKDNAANMQGLFQSLKILGQNDFTTSDGARAIRMVTERDDDQTKKRLRQIFYFFDAGNKKLIATCSSLAEDGAALDKVFDAAMKTFAVTKKPS